MESKKKHTPKYVIITLVLLGMAALIGLNAKSLLSFSSNQPQPHVSNKSEPELEQEQAKQEALRSSDYIISKPHVGTMIKTHNIELKYTKNGWAEGTVSAKTALPPRTKQDVILKDVQGATLPLGGVIRRVQRYKEQLNLLISLPVGTKTELLSTNADILLMDNHAAKRIPLSALQKDKNGNAYIWVAEPTDDAAMFKATKTWVDKYVAGEKYFEPALYPVMNTLVILEPDKKIKNGQSYKMKEVPFTGPLSNPIEVAYQAFVYAEEEKERLEFSCENLRKEEAKIKEENKGQPIQATEGCNTIAPDNGQLDPLQIFNNILKKQPIGSGAAACGSGSCGS